MCFVNMGIEDVVSSIVEAMLPRFSDDKTVLVMSFDLRVRKEGDYKKLPVSRMVHLMFQRPNNYTKAMWNVSTEWNSYRNYTSWQVKCDHDSCWRTDGVGSPFFELAQNMLKEVRPQVQGCPEADVSIRFHDGPKLVQLQYHSMGPEKRIFTVEYAPEAKKA